MATKHGIVERITRKDGRTTLLIDGEWYSTFEAVELKPGAEVEFSYTVVKKNNRVYRNIQAIQPVGEPSPAPEGISEAERIARSVALKAAVESLGPGGELEQVLERAEVFLGFLMGGEEE